MATPMLVSFRITGDKMVETWPNGLNLDFQVVKNNRYGIVAISAISEIEPGKTSPTVGAQTFVLVRQTRQFWLSSVATGQPAKANEITEGKCTNK